MEQDKLAYDIYMLMCDYHFKNNGALIRDFTFSGKRVHATSYSPFDYKELFTKVYESQDINNSMLLYRWIKSLSKQQLDDVCTCVTWDDMRKCHGVVESLLNMYWLMDFPLGK